MDNPKAAYILRPPKLPPISQNAKANNITLATFINIPCDIPVILLTTKAKPDTPPAAISLG